MVNIFSFHKIVLIRTSERGINTYVNVDSLTFDSYKQHWLSSHLKWTKFDSTSLSCTGQNIFPVCNGDISISDDSLTCPRTECISSEDCQPTPADTIDLIPPPLLTTSDSHLCTESIYSNEVMAPHYGLDRGIPPLYTPLKVTNLVIRGRLRARFGEVCKPIVGATIDFWHVETTRLDAYSDPEIATDSRASTDEPLTPTQIRSLSCRGESASVEGGYFEIRTTMPFSYGPPRHINVMVTAPDFEPLITRMYFSSDIRLQQLVLDREAEDNFDGFDTTFGSFLSYQVEGDPGNGGPTLSSYLGKDPRIVNISFVKDNSSLVNGPFAGHFEGRQLLTLRPLRQSPDGTGAALVPAVNLTGFWADDEGALVRVENHGHMFFAMQYPHARTWGSVWGNLRGDTISGVDFRASGTDI